MATKKEEEQPAEGRRVVMRRRGGFSNSGLSDSSRVEGTPRDINAEVREAALRPAATTVPAPLPEDQSEADRSLQSSANIEDFSPQQRLRQVGRRASEYEREYRLSLLHRMLMRKMPLDEIAHQLEISVSQVMRDRAELRERLRAAARELNIDEMIGHNQGFYEEVVAMSMRAASNAQQPMPMRLSALRTALAGQNDLHRFLQAAGVYDVLRFRRLPGGDGQNDIQRMMALTEELMGDAARGRREAANPNPLGDFSGGDDRETL
jgi:hypothetical protein